MQRCGGRSLFRPDGYFEKILEQHEASTMAGKRPSFRKKLSKPGLLKVVRACFEAIPDDVRGRLVLVGRLCDVGSGGVFAEVFVVADSLTGTRVARQMIQGEPAEPVQGSRKAPSDSWLAQAAGRCGPAGVAEGLQAGVQPATTRQGAGWGMRFGRGTICSRSTERARFRRARCTARTAVRPASP